MKDVVRMWHNMSNKRLDDAVAKLRRIITRRKKLVRMLHPWWISGWVLVPVVLLALSVYLAAVYGRWQLLAVVAGLWVLYYAVLGVLLVVNSVHRRMHADLLRAGEYGHAIMFDVDAEWLALQSAMQTEAGGQRIMTAFLADPGIAPALTEYLMASRHVRHRLQECKRRPKPTHPDMVKLQQFANQAAARINRLLAEGEQHNNEQG